MHEFDNTRGIYDTGSPHYYFLFMRIVRSG